MSDSRAVRYIMGRVWEVEFLIRSGRVYLHLSPSSSTSSPSWWTSSWKQGSGRPWGARAGPRPGVGAAPAGWPAGPWPVAAGGWR